MRVKNLIGDEKSPTLFLSKWMVDVYIHGKLEGFQVIHCVSTRQLVQPMHGPVVPVRHVNEVLKYGESKRVRQRCAAWYHEVKVCAVQIRKSRISKENKTVKD